MELFAAMVEYMGDQIGRLIAHLKKTGKYDNTLIVFISDNGAAGEDMAELVTKLAPAAKDWFDKTFDNRLENLGRPGSCAEYGPPWVKVSSVPFRLFKGGRGRRRHPRPAQGVISTMTGSEKQPIGGILSTPAILGLSARAVVRRW